MTVCLRCSASSSHFLIIIFLITVRYSYQATTALKWTAIACYILLLWNSCTKESPKENLLCCSYDIHSCHSAKPRLALVVELSTGNPAWPLLAHEILSLKYFPPTTGPTQSVYREENQAEMVETSWNENYKSNPEEAFTSTCCTF